MPADRLFSVHLTPPNAETITAIVLAASSEEAGAKVLEVVGLERASVEVTDCKDRDVVIVLVEATAGEDDDGEEEVHVGLRLEAKKA